MTTVSHSLPPRFTSGEGPFTHFSIPPDLEGFSIDSIRVLWNGNFNQFGVTEATFDVHVFAGGENPGAEIWTGQYTATSNDINPNFHILDTSLEPELGNLVGDFWLWFELTDIQADRLWPEPIFSNRLWGADHHYEYDGFNIVDANADWFIRVVGNATLGPGLTPPTDLTADLDQETGQVTLNWEFEGGGPGETEELIYDNDVATGFYTFNGSTMATHMSPAGPCQVLTLKYYTGGVGAFNAEVYGWTGPLPDTELLHSEAVTSVDEDWLEVDVSTADIMFDGDFTVGFGSINAIAALGFDENLNNGRSFDFSNNSWSAWTEAYLIRAVVQYTDGMIAELTPIPVEPRRAVGEKVRIPNLNPQPAPADNELDDFIEFIVYRNGDELGRTTQTTFVDELTQEGEYTYTVTAWYDEGESWPAGPVVVNYELSVEENAVSGLPAQWGIESVYPNPFNPAVNVMIAVPEISNVRVEIVNILGQRVSVLNSGKLNAGYHRITWNADNYPSGLYFLNVTSDTGYNGVEKLMFVK